MSTSLICNLMSVTSIGCALCAEYLVYLNCIDKLLPYVTWRTWYILMMSPLRCRYIYINQCSVVVTKCFPLLYIKFSTFITVNNLCNLGIVSVQQYVAHISTKFTGVINSLAQLMLWRVMVGSWLFNTISQDPQRAWISSFVYKEYVVGGEYLCNFFFIFIL